MLLVLVSCIISACLAHVTLVHPPAILANDFLDNIRTVEPCGIAPRGTNRAPLVLTTQVDQQPMGVLAGSTDAITITWHLAYPHVGTSRLSVLSCSSSFATSPPSTADCDEVPLFSSAANETTLQSATVNRTDIVQGCAPDAASCFIRLRRNADEYGAVGAYRFSSCSYIGSGAELRQLRPEEDDETDGDEHGCVTDADCGSLGRCLPLVPSSVPVVVPNHPSACFCPLGHFGPQCNNVSAFSAPEDVANVTEDDGFHRWSGADWSVLYRVVNGTLDIVARAPTNSWVAVGFRPTRFQSAIGDPSNTSAVQPSPASCGVDTVPDPEAAALASSTPRCAPTTARPGDATDCHPMNAQDIVVGLARVGDDGTLLHRVFDGYTPNRATPLPDSAFGGVDDLTDAAAVEDVTTGITHVRYRRPAVTSDCFDHQAVPGLLHDLIFAFGSEMPRHSPDIPDPSDVAFYAPDLIKYHGADHRHWTSARLAAEPPAAVPPSDRPGNDEDACDPSPLPDYTCRYRVDDTLVLHSAITDDTVRLAGVIADDGGYLAFGPSPDGSMIDSHVVLADRSTGATRILDLVDKTVSDAEASLADDASGDRVIASSFTASGGSLTVEQTRVRTAELASPDGAFFVYAVGPPSGQTEYHGTRKASFRLALGGAGGSGVTLADDIVDVAAVHDARVAHATLMAIGWGLVLPLGILASAHGRSAFATRFGSDGAWFTLGHRPLQLLGLALTLSAFIVALVLLSPASLALWPGHGVVGLIIMIGALAQPLNALLRPAAPTNPAHRAKGRTWWELTHRGIGYASAIAALVNMSLGLQLYQALEIDAGWDALSVIVVLLQIIGILLVGRSLLHCAYPTDDSTAADGARDGDNVPLRAAPPVKVPPREARPAAGPRVLSTGSQSTATAPSRHKPRGRSRRRERAAP